MKFYGVGQVWDKDNKKVLCTFGGSSFDSNGYTLPGAYETKSERETKILKDLEYETDYDKAILKLRQSDVEKIKEDTKKTKTVKSEKQADEDK